jgi:hypothetical protein
MSQKPTLRSENEKTIDLKGRARTTVDEATDDDTKGESLQHGVRGARAVNQVWTKNHLILAYALYVLPYRHQRPQSSTWSALKTAM